MNKFESFFAFFILYELTFNISTSNTLFDSDTIISSLASKVTESKEMGNHPLYPPGRVRDLSLRVGEQGKAAVWPAAKKCVIPTISECRNISHTKTTKTKKPQQ